MGQVKVVLAAVDQSGIRDQTFEQEHTVTEGGLKLQKWVSEINSKCYHTERKVYVTEEEQFTDRIWECGNGCCTCGRKLYLKVF